LEKNLVDFMDGKRVLPKVTQLISLLLVQRLLP
jgi:hypothetical protein